MSGTEKVKKMRRGAGRSGQQGTGAGAGATPAGERTSRARKSLPLQQPEPLTAEQVAGFQGEVLTGEVTAEAPPASSSRARGPKGADRREEPQVRPWLAATEAQRQQAERIDLHGGPAARGWRKATQSELRETLVQARVEAELTVHWYEYLATSRQTDASEVDAQDVQAAREAMLERNSSTGGPEWIAQAYQLRFGTVPQEEVDAMVDLKVESVRAYWIETEAGAQARPAPQRHRARGMFGTSARERERSQRQRTQESMQREELVAGSQLDERDHIRLLRMNSRLAADEYMCSLRESNILVPGFSDEQRAAGLDQRQKVYTRMMVLGALRPLSNGVSTNSVIQAMGAMTTMLILSKDFRSEMGSYVEPLKKGIQDRIEDKTRAQGARADYQARQRDHANAGEGVKSDRNDFLSRKWQRRLEDLERRERGNRELYTVETAAMTEIGLAENAYMTMRAQGADVKEVMQSYQAMLKKVRDQSLDDGLDPQEVATATRTILGRRMETEPELQAVFNGMAHGKYVRSQPHPEQVMGSGHVRTVWTGQFEDHLGKKVPPDVMFTLRPVMGGDHHQAAVATVMQERMLHGMQKEGMAGFQKSFEGYMVGFAAAEVNLEGRLGERIDGQDMPSWMREHARQCELMMASMVSDGLDPQERQRVYSNAYVDAIEHVRGLYPEFAVDWDNKYGPTWQDRMREATADPRRFAAQEMAGDRKAGSSSGFAQSYTQQDEGEHTAPPASQDEHQPA